MPRLDVKYMTSTVLSQMPQNYMHVPEEKNKNDMHPYVVCPKSYCKMSEPAFYAAG